MNGVRTLALAGMIVALAGCQSTSGSGVGSLIGGSPKVIGGLAGSQIGRDLAFFDRDRALAAEYRALEYGRSGTATQWSDGLTGRHGEVVPGTAYKVNDTTCREYTHKIVAGGQTETARGTACRAANGNWQTVG